MAATRYWRLVGIETAGGGDLEISEVALYSGGVRVDGSATLTCSHANIAGALAYLKDGSTSTACRFAAEDVRSPGFFLQWEFGSATEVEEIKLGSAGNAAEFMLAATIVQGASVGVWSYVDEFSGAVYPGASAMTTSGSGGVAPTEWNPADKGSGCTLSNGNLTAAGGQSTGWVRSVYGATSGKYYWEITSTGSRFPIVALSVPGTYLGGDWGGVPGFWVYYGPGPLKAVNAVYTSYGTKWTSSSQVVGMALDMEAGTITVSLNGASMGVMFSGVAGTIHAATAGDTDSAASDATANFGASAFANSIPVGHSAGFGPTKTSLPITTARLAHTLRSSIGIAARSAVPPHNTPNPSLLQLARDVEHGGPGTIYGTTKTKGTPNLPTKARVVLLHQRSKQPVRETWSDPVTGAFAFTGIDATQQFLTLAEDAAGNFRPVAANKLTPEVIG